MTMLYKKGEGDRLQKIKNKQNQISNYAKNDMNMK